MKTWKLVSGILSMVLFVIVMVQSCAAGAANTLAQNGGSSGSAGFIFGILMLCGAIVSVSTRKSTGKGSNIALIILFGLASLIGFTSHGNYKDLVIWSVWTLINAALALVAILKAKKKPEEPKEQ